MTEVVSRQKSDKSKPKTPTKTQLLKKCDATFSKIIRSRGCCEICGSTEALQCAHGFSRRYRATRYEAQQCWCLCRGCHYRFTVRPLHWDEWMRERMGPDLYHDMRIEALIGPNPDLTETLARLRAELDLIESEIA